MHEFYLYFFTKKCYNYKKDYLGDKMIVDLQLEDAIQFNKLKETMHYNTLFTKVLANYLNYNSLTINKKIISAFKKEVNINDEEAFYHLFYSFFIDELSISKNEKDALDIYLKNTIKLLKREDYFNNAYSLRINVNNKEYKNWSFKNEEYDCYQGFIYNETFVDEMNYFLEIPSFGFFNKKFNYLAVLENKREWMTITPNEINTMQKAIDEANGNVITFGLGLGYYPYMVSLKDDVKNVTIVEKDPNVIDMFTKNILPLFPNGDKIKIVNEDAFEFLKDNNLIDFNYVFVDIWHDVKDGIFLYLKFKAIEDNYSLTFNYWIENEMILMLRKIIIRLIDENISNIDSLNVKSNNDKLNELYTNVYYCLLNTKLNSYYDIFKLLKKDSLQILAKFIYKKGE